MRADWKEAQQKAARTARWAVTMAKVRIRRVASRTRWQLVTFYGESGAESVGVVDMLAIRKDHGLHARSLVPNSLFLWTQADSFHSVRDQNG